MLLPGGARQQVERGDPQELLFYHGEDCGICDPEDLVNTPLLSPHFCIRDRCRSDEGVQERENSPGIPVEKDNGTIMGHCCFDMAGPVLFLVIACLLVPADRVVPVVLDVKAAAEPEEGIPFCRTR